MLARWRIGSMLKLTMTDLEIIEFYQDSWLCWWRVVATQASANASVGQARRNSTVDAGCDVG